MSGNGKRYEAAAKLVGPDREYLPPEAIKLVKEFPDAKFDESVEVAFRLGVDPRKADQMVRGTVSLPHGTG
ncbi:MAG TPA: 50S ribosomal protein L1, partial [Actinomycetota bacterium]